MHMGAVNIFFKAYKLNQYFCYMRILFLDFKPASFKRKINLSLLLASLKTFINSKTCFESRTRILLRLSYALIGRFSQAYIHGQLSEQLLESQAAIRKPEQAP